MSQRVKVEELNPEGLPSNPAFSNVMTVSGPVKTIQSPCRDQPVTVTSTVWGWLPA